MRVELAPADALDEAPVAVDTVAGRFILSADESGSPVLYSAVCPHQRGRVRPDGDDRLLCPNHRWAFDAVTGDCLTVEDASLPSFPVELSDDALYADLPD